MTMGAAILNKTDRDTVKETIGAAEILGGETTGAAEGKTGGAAEIVATTRSVTVNENARKTEIGTTVDGMAAATEIDDAQLRLRVEIPVRALLDALARETNTVRAVNGDTTVLKYNEPPEARKPILGWRLYVFKGTEQVELLHIHRQSAYLFGRDRLVADVALDHPSCSKQHAVIQYRFIQQKDEFGVSKGSIKPFIIDLESTNGTHVNDQAIPVSRYYELKASDVIKFGQSTREYVLLHDEAT
ncbi:SMAD/FHA domain-containing protein [Mycena filopes]|nr:SMAD/FHA domain-containing protein [Mycena filopes]